MKEDNARKVAVVTLGCRVNQSESLVIEGTLRNHGVSVVPLDEKPDCCIINTCTVTARSDANSRMIIRKALKTGAKVIVTGCYAQRNHDEVVAMGSLCDVVSVNNKLDIIDKVLGYHASPVYSFHGRSRPYLKVQDGCNFSCTYCAVPLARGRSVSVPLGEVIGAASEIASRGYNEIVLTGIHIGTYGRDLPEKTTLAGLLKRLLSSAGVPRIRLSSIEINEVDDEMLELLGDSRICRHLHLPLQSGSDRILGLMKRNYTVSDFIRRIDRISSAVPDIALGTDVIVGFPGESDNDFSKTFKLLNDVPFSYMHIFPYSKRPGTTAADFKPQISGHLIDNRAETLKELNQARKRAFALKQHGRILDIITEEPDRKGHIIGTSSNYLKISLASKELKAGSIVVIRSVATDEGILKGNLIA